MSEITGNERTSWAVNPYPWRETQALAAALGLPPIVATVLAGRGLTDPAEARAFIECSYPLPSPFLFGHMEQTVATLGEAVQQGRRIVIHGDYDADGITATALMVCGLLDLGLEAEWYLPNRFNEGFGLSRTAVETIAAGGPGVLVTVDCGVNYPEEVELAKQAGLDVVVVDHHRPGPVLPACHLIHHVVGEYPHGDLCGVGLALKVMHALHIRLAGASIDALPERLYPLLDLVALGTVADLATLKGENRYYVREGLKLIAIGQRVGIRALASVSGCTGVADSGTVAYRLAPRLNAAGRLADPSPPLRLLLTNDEREAAKLAVELHELNGARQEVERQILEEAVEQVEKLSALPPAIVLAGQEWHEGVVGIVASRLVERYHRPSILLGIREGVAKGSGRSVPGYDLITGLNAAAGLLTVYGGHTQAVGLTLRADRLDDFRRTMEEHAARMLDEDALTPIYRADAVLRGVDINVDTVLALASLGPFGSGNPRPRLLLVGADVQDAETTRNGAHLRCDVQVDGIRVRGIGFGMGEKAAGLREQPRGRLVGVQLRVDEWQGVPRPEFLIERIGDSEVDLAGVPDRQEARTEPRLPAQDEGTSGRGSGVDSPFAMPPARDMRDQQGLTSAIAQVLATGERVLIVTGSPAQALSDMRVRLPLAALASGEVATYGDWKRDETVSGGLDRARVAVVDWESVAGTAYAAAGTAHAAAENAGLVADTACLAADRAHIVAVDPPFRASHLAFLRCATAQGALVHLCYGKEERLATAGLLRHTVHPRFAMICVYRAMQEAGGQDDGVLERARELGRQEAGVDLTERALRRAQAILAELGIERPCLGEAKLEARSISAYVAAEADYEECSRLCLTL
ncbi:MAG: single-stranded-DNA-specific exonuclease RecJ [Thermoleophilia bacterium]|nr:single-stranded-DNA-specific exonuclease RecJ [Thermoleophilia bacterium]